MKKYQSYKPSGNEWIGDIPEHWGISKVKYTSEIFGRIGYRGYTIEDIVNEGEGVITISPSNIKNDIFTMESSLTYISYEKYYQSPEIMIFPNDIILVKTGSTIGKTSIVPDNVPEMTINPQLIVLKNIKMNHKFYYYQTTCDYFKNSFFVEQTGSTTPTISQEKVNNFPLLIPTPNEQHQIVQFLEEKTEIIDKLISTKQRKIDLLKQQRTSLINQIITKGLDPNIKMKDSGVEWIGDIPEHWDCKLLKYVVKSNEKVLTENTDPFYELNYIEIGDVDSSGNINNSTQYLFKDCPSRCRRILSKGDVLVSTVRTYLKSIGYIKDEVEDLICSTGFCVLTPSKKIIPTYLFYQILTEYFIGEVISKSQGVSYPSITSTELINIKILVPSVNEQHQIVEFLDTRTKEIDDLISLEQRKIDVLKDYRKSLISEVITGKIDVRTNLN